MNGFYDARVDSLNKIGVWKQAPSFIPIHFHNSIELLYVLKGSAAISIDNKIHTIDDGKLAAINSFSVHSVDYRPDGIFYGLMIPRSYLLEWNKLLDDNTFAEPIIWDDEKRSIGHLIELMYDIHENSGMFETTFRSDDRSDISLQLLSKVLMNIVICRCPLIERKHMTTAVAEAINYIINHYTEKLLVSDIAHALYLNTQRLSEQFYAVMGVTIVNYIKNLRAAEMKRLLLSHPDISIESAAKLAGFSSNRSMYRTICEIYGCTPNQLRCNASQKAVDELPESSDIKPETEV